MGLFNLFSKKQKEANQSFLAEQRGQQAIAKIKKLNLPERLKKQLIDAGIYDIWFNDKELVPLVNAIRANEIIQYAAIGINEHSENVMLVCTNRNLIILRKKHSDEQAEVISLKQIKSVILKNQLAYVELSLINGNESLDINSINKAPAEILANNLKKWSKIVQGEDDDFDQQVEQIKKLKDLLDQGILTEEEFQEKKKKILGIQIFGLKKSCKIKYI